MLKHSVAQWCVKCIGWRHCGNTGGHSVRSDKVDSGVGTVLEVGCGHPAEVVGMVIDMHGTLGAGQGILAAGSSVDIPVGVVEGVDEPEIQGNIMPLVADLQVGNTLLGGVALPLLLHLNTKESQPPYKWLGLEDPHFHHNPSLVDSKVGQLFALELLLAVDPLGPLIAAVAAVVANQIAPAVVIPADDPAEVVAALFLLQMDILTYDGQMVVHLRCGGQCSLHLVSNSLEVGPQ